MSANKLIICYADALWDVNEHWIKCINNQYNKNLDTGLTEKEIIETGSDDIVSPEMLYNILRDTDFWNTLEPKINSVQSLYNLVEQSYQVYICIDYPYTYIADALMKLLSVYSFISDKNIIKCSAPELLMGDIVISSDYNNLSNTSAQFKILQRDVSTTELENDSIYVADWIEIYKLIPSL